MNIYISPTGVDDLTRCYACGGGLRKWEAGDDPYFEHARWYPNCEYIIKLKGPIYVQDVVRRDKERAAEQRQRQQQQQQQQQRRQQRASGQGNQPSGRQKKKNGKKKNKGRGEAGNNGGGADASEESSESVVEEVVNEGGAVAMKGNSSRKIAPAGEPTEKGASGQGNQPSGRQKKKNGKKKNKGRGEAGNNGGGADASEEASESVVEEVVNEGGAVAMKGNSSRKIAPAGEPTEKGASDQPSGKQEKKNGKKKGNGRGGAGNNGGGADASEEVSESVVEEVVNEGGAVAMKGNSSREIAPAGEPTEKDTQQLEAENKKLREMLTCKICMDKPVNMTFLPCGHLVCCESCSPHLSKCSICELKIEDSVKTLMS